MKIERVQYDSEGEWLDVHFSDGRGWRLPAPRLRWLIDEEYNPHEVIERIEELKP